MGFLNSLTLWSGLAAAGVAVPIVIHLLYRKHRRQTDWAAMELLRRALVIRSGQVKLEDYLLLLLRCLALLLIAAALLRPTLNSDSTQWLGEKRVGMVVAVDASYSMNHGEHSRYERAIAKAREILNNARQGDPVSLVLMSNRPQILLRRTGYEADRFDELLDEQQNPTSYRLSLERNLEQLDELVAELKTPARECYLITDGQELDWAELSDEGRESLTRLTGSASVFLVPVSTDGEENLGLIRLSYASGSLQKSGVARFTAQVRNQGRRLAHGGAIEFSVEDELITRRAVGPLNPGETRAVSFFASFDSPGDVRLQAHLTKDELTDDNDRFAVVNIRPAIRVLCVDDDLSDDAASSRSGSYYVVRALRLRDRESDETPLRVQQIASPDLSLETLSDFDIILLANVADVAPEMVKRLDRFVRRGGGLVLFLGDRVDSELYNQRFGGGDNPLLPGKLLKTVSIPEDHGGWVIGPVQSDHSLANIVKRLQQELVDAARFSKIIRVEPAAESQTILTVAQERSPLLLERHHGAGTVLMFTTSADRSWNELAIHPLYTMLLQQAVTNMTSHPDSRQATVGQSAALQVPGREIGDPVQLTDPAGVTTESKVTQAEQRSVCAIDTEFVGIYEVAGTADLAATAVAANVDPAESNVRVVDAGALSSQLDPLGVRVVAESAALETAINSSRQGRELAGILLLMGIGVFLLQSFLAKYFTNRMSSGEADVSAALQMRRVAAARRT